MRKFAKGMFEITHFLLRNERNFIITTVGIVCDVRFLFSENAANLKIRPTTRPNLENKRNYRNEVGSEHYIVMTCFKTVT